MSDLNSAQPTENVCSNIGPNQSRRWTALPALLVVVCSFLWVDNAYAAAGPPRPEPLDRLWVLFSACLVFLMQAGFLVFEAGCVRPNNATSVALKNVLDWLVTTLAFCFVGFGLMFGASWNGLVGTTFDAFQALSTDESAFGLEFLLFQLGFAGTAATIVSGAMAERTSLVTYAFVALAIGLVIYPVFGHWAWGGALLGTQAKAPLLADLGFMDFAGGTVVHSLGGWVSLVGTWFLGPRLGRFSASGKPRPLPQFGLTWSALGVFVLWFGWWGFNGGSTLALNGGAVSAIVNTNMAGAAGGLVAFAHALGFNATGSRAQKFWVGSWVDLLRSRHAVTSSPCLVPSSWER